jgi:hypothetical protein
METSCDTNSSYGEWTEAQYNLLDVLKEDKVLADDLIEDLGGVHMWTANTSSIMPSHSYDLE